MIDITKYLEMSAEELQGVLDSIPIEPWMIPLSKQMYSDTKSFMFYSKIERMKEIAAILNQTLSRHVTASYTKLNCCTESTPSVDYNLAA